MDRFRLVSPFRPEGDQPEAIAAARGGDPRRDQGAGAPRRHRLGQDLHHRQGDRGDQPADARPVAQQDARGAALPGVQELLPGQRGRVLRHLLRLLPARGLRPADRHLHREGDLDQRRDRQAAAGRHQGAVRAPRRDDRGLGVVHLRPGLAGGLLRHAPLLRARRERGHGPRHAPAGRHAVRAHPVRPLPRQLPRPRRRARDPPRLRGARHPRRVLRRRDRAHHPLRSAARRGARGGGPDRGLPEDPLRDAARDSWCWRSRASGRSWRSGWSSSRSRASSSSASGSSSAPASTSRCSRSWATAPASRTTRATSRGGSRARRRRPCSTTSRTTSC